MPSEAEIRLWVAVGVANGLRPWFTKKWWPSTCEELTSRTGRPSKAARQALRTAASARHTPHTSHAPMIDTSVASHRLVGPFLAGAVARIGF